MFEFDISVFVSFHDKSIKKQKIFFVPIEIEGNNKKTNTTKNKDTGHIFMRVTCTHTNCHIQYTHSPIATHAHNVTLN